MDTSTRPLEELVTELSPSLRAQVREYVEYLLARPEPQADEPERAEVGREAVVSLQEITEDTVRTVCSLTDTLTPPKKYMVAPNAISIAQAHFSQHAWFRAIYADDTPVGFVMLYDDPQEPEYFLWRYMIAGPHHGKGFGRRGIELLVDYVKTRPGAKVLQTSCGQGPGSPEGFYRKIGFERNGKMIGSEVGLSLIL
ncbi:MAG TPA: GNAT family N-acetyltransferase [Anaerolineae bacterium]|nr:GNAT family N-acetyltransferase [Anaerolineae bacterium]